MLVAAIARADGLGTLFSVSANNADVFPLMTAAQVNATDQIRGISDLDTALANAAADMDVYEKSLAAKPLVQPQIGQPYDQVWQSMGTADGVDHLGGKDQGHFDWYYDIPGSNNRMQVRFTNGLVSSVKTVDGPKPRQVRASRTHDGPSKWARFGQAVAVVGATLVVADTCATVHNKPVLLMTASDWECVQTCKAAGFWY